jgi:UDP-N-acetylglucosamine 2-epimerase (non-hydrolysing)
MLKQVVDIFDLPIDFELDIMVPEQTLAGLSARLLSKIDAFLDNESPDFALVQGDTTTVLMASICCFYRKIPVGHVEAGLRTGNMSSPFPEEANRKLVTPLASIHFAPTSISQQNLLDEGVLREKIHVTGNTVIDALLMEIEQQKKSHIQKKIQKALTIELGESWHSKPYVLITGHRRENFGYGFDQICAAIVELANLHRDIHFVYPVHLNPNVKEIVEKKLVELDNVFLLPPQGYRNFVALMNNAKLVLTDSGGVQEEAPSLGKPVLVMRDTTERPEGINAGTVRLVGANRNAIIEGVTLLLQNDKIYKKISDKNNPYGDGTASKHIAKLVFYYLNKKNCMYTD